MTFAFSKYTREGAAKLAQEFCRRATYYFCLCHGSGDPDTFQYDVASVENFIEDDVFMDYVLAFDADDARLVKAHLLRALLPCEL